MIGRKYKCNRDWKPAVRSHQFHKVFKNAMFGFNRNWKVAKVRFLRQSKSYPFSYNSGYNFRRD